MKVVQTYTDFRISVECIHPEESSRFYEFAITVGEHECWNFDEAEIRKQIEEKVNKYHFWHEVDITITVILDGEIYSYKI